MGNTIFTSVCRREEIVDFEDISDATFDFISVAVDPATTKNRKTLSPRSPAFDSVPKIVAVVPMALDDNASTRPTTPVPEETLSFNDRLNMLTWDPETTPLPAPFKPHEFYVFDEYSPRPHNTTSPSTKTRKQSRGWLSRAMDKYQESKTRRREATQRRKRTRPVSATASKTTTTKHKDQPYHLPLMTSTRNLLEEDDEDERFVLDYDVELLTKTWNPSQDLPKTKYNQELLSDTESDDSGSDATTLCAFYNRHYLEDDEDDASSRSSLDDEDSDCEFSDWTRSSSTSSCYFSAAEDEGPSDDTGFFSSPAAVCKTVSEYLCECNDCPTYVAIEREVTNSNCWMNEAERRSLCRILQAHSTYKPSTPFCKDMIASAEECLLVFQADENAAFNAFLMIAQTKW